MTFSKRERLIIVATGAVLLLLILDSYLLTPLLDSYDELQVRKDRLEQELIESTKLVKKQRVIKKRWQQMLEDGLKSDAIEAESQLLHAVQNWASKSRFRLSSIRPERSNEDETLKKIDFHATGTGTMSSISKFLYYAETTRIPARILSVRITSRKEGLDSLTLDFQVSTVYYPDQKNKNKTPVAIAGGKK